MTPADSVRRLEIQNFGLPQFCASFDVFSCGVLPESGGVGTPAETLFTMGKGLKEFRFCDSTFRRVYGLEAYSRTSAVCQRHKSAANQLHHEDD